MWVLEYSREANNYALDSHPYNEEVLMAIESLPDMEDGLPEDNWIEWEPENFLWEVAEHWVLYQRIWSNPPRLLVLAIKPLPA